MDHLSNSSSNFTAWYKITLTLFNGKKEIYKHSVNTVHLFSYLLIGDVRKITTELI